MGGEATISKSNFKDRIDLLIGRFGTRYSLAAKSGVPDGTLQSWMKGHVPSRAVLDVAKAAGVSVEWLLTGEGDAGTSAAPEVDFERLRQALEILDEFSQTREGRGLPSRKRAECLFFLYGTHGKKGKLPDRKKLLETLKLLA